MTKIIWKLAAGSIVAAALHAQTGNPDTAKKQQERQRKMMLNVRTATAQVQISSPVFGMVGKVVQGAPYTADATTESVQVLADGTRLRHHTSVFVARDGAGRIARQENGKTVLILDPVANLTYHIDHRQKTVEQLPLTHTHESTFLAMGGGYEIFPDGRPPVVMTIRYLGLKSVTVQDILRVFKEHNVGLSVESRYDPARVELAVDVLKELLAQRGHPNAGVEVNLDQSNSRRLTIAFVVDEDRGLAAESALLPIPKGSYSLGPDKTSTKTEGLGRRIIEGLVADGTRITETVPSGAMGNDPPMQTISEHWYSPDLQLNIKTERHDPLIGDIVFQLTNIRRGEPAHTLFEVPPDYTAR